MSFLSFKHGALGRCQFSEAGVGPQVIVVQSGEMVGAFVDSYIEEWNKGARYLDGLNELLERLESENENAARSRTLRNHCRLGESANETSSS